MDRKRFGKAALGAVLSLFLALQVGCDGNGPSGVTVLEVGGSWIEVSTVVFDGCDLDLDPTATTDVTIIPSESQITFVFHFEGQDVAVTGTFNSRTGDFTLPLTNQQGTLVISIVQSGRFSSNTRYTSQTEIVITDAGVSCTIRTTEVGQRSS